MSPMLINLSLIHWAWLSVFGPGMVGPGARFKSCPWTWSLSSLPVGLHTGRLGQVCDLGWRLGGLDDGVVSGQADFGGPALDDGPEPMARRDVAGGGDVGQGHGGDGRVAVEDLAGQPGHLPSVPVPKDLASGVRALVAGHGGVVNDQSHSSRLL